MTRMGICIGFSDNTGSSRNREGAAMLTRESTFRKGPGGLLFAQIENDLAKATVCLQGAQKSITPYKGSLDETENKVR
jgi:hypothetical protein